MDAKIQLFETAANKTIMRSIEEYTYFYHKSCKVH